MMKLEFDAELKGADGAVVPVYCEVQPPYVGGQKSVISMAVPAEHIVGVPPKNPCTLSGRCGRTSINMQGIHWRRFPTSSNCALGLKTIELLHIDELKVTCSSIETAREIRLHLAPISYLRSEFGWIGLGDKSDERKLFTLDLPDIGAARFVAEGVTIYDHDAEIPGATSFAGFSAVVNLPVGGVIDAEEIISKFKSSLAVLSILFRQAVTLHGWTLIGGQTVTTWIDPLAPNVTTTAREERGDFLVSPQLFVECATNLAHAYAKADKETRSLVRHISLAVNPHIDARSPDRFLFMFTALERVIEFAWKRDQTPKSPAVTTLPVIKHLQALSESIIAEGGDFAVEISARVKGLIQVMERPSVRDKVEAFFRFYPQIQNSGDLWPILGSNSKRGLREIRNSLAHGTSVFTSVNVVAVAGWHLAIYLERLVFVLLDIPIPDGISPGSFPLRTGARGWYERDWWVPLQTMPGRPI
jgi:hypothetical protein